jgi:hypothetical protein
LAVEPGDEAVEIAFENIPEIEGGGAELVEDGVEAFVLGKLDPRIEILAVRVGQPHMLDRRRKPVEVLEGPFAHRAGHRVGLFELQVVEEGLHGRVGHIGLVGGAEIRHRVEPGPFGRLAPRRHHDPLERGVEPRPEEVEDEILEEALGPLRLGHEPLPALDRAPDRGELEIGLDRKPGQKGKAPGDKENKT